MECKDTYTKKEFDRQMDYADNKCAQCLRHQCQGFKCPVQYRMARVAERTPDITDEQKRRYFYWMK